MSILDEDIYFSDYSENLVVLDSHFNVKKRIGSKGQGPGELLGANHFYIAGNDSIYIINDGKQAVELFVGEKHTAHIPFPSEVRLNSSRFFVENQSVFHSIVPGDFPVIVFDEHSRINQYLCNYTDLDNPDLRLHSDRHVLKGDKAFFLIGRTLPVFQMYSGEGKLKGEYDLRQIQEIDKTVKTYNATPQVPTTYFVMIQDVYYDNQKVYLLIATENPYSCNLLCVFDIKEEIKHVQTFQQEGKIYGSFCVKNNKLIAFNTMDASLDVFTLPE
jgi:hypothetical protein